MQDLLGLVRLEDRRLRVDVAQGPVDPNQGPVPDLQVEVGAALGQERP